MSKDLFVSVSGTIGVVIFLYVKNPTIDGFLLSLISILGILYLGFQIKRVAYLLVHHETLANEMCIGVCVSVLIGLVYYIYGMLGIDSLDCYQMILQKSLWLVLFSILIFFLIRIAFLPKYERQCNDDKKKQ